LEVIAVVVALRPAVASLPLLLPSSASGACGVVSVAHSAAAAGEEGPEVDADAPPSRLTAAPTELIEGSIMPVARATLEQLSADGE